MDRLLKMECHSFGVAVLDQIVDWIAYNLEPSQVFPDEILVEWAEDSGFSKVEQSD